MQLQEFGVGSAFALGVFLWSREIFPSSTFGFFVCPYSFSLSRSVVQEASPSVNRSNASRLHHRPEDSLQAPSRLPLLKLPYLTYFTTRVLLSNNSIDNTVAQAKHRLGSEISQFRKAKSNQIQLNSTKSIGSRIVYKWFDFGVPVVFEFFKIIKSKD